MIKITEYEIIPFLPEGCSIADKKFNNGTGWLRETINTLYNRSKGSLKASGIETNHFHNHNEETNKTLARYPLVQYQRRENRYFVVGINQGGLLLDELFSDVREVYTINRQLHIVVARREAFEYSVEVKEEEISYSLKNWLPLSNENHKIYGRLNALSDKINFLEKMLKNHIINDFARHLQKNINPNEIKVFLTGIDSFENSMEKLKQDKHIKHFQPFDIEFRTNIVLPVHICLGNATVYGFGLLNYGH